MPTEPKVIVAHMGARHGYAVPRILHQRGALSRLYTDLSAKGVVASAAAAWPMRFDLPVVGKLRRRTVKGIPPSMVYSAPMVNMRSALATGKTQQERYAIENRLFGAQMQRWGVGDANIVYGMYGSGVPFWRHAKSQGLKIVVDYFIREIDKGVYAVVPGKFSLAFSLAVNTYMRLTGGLPGKDVKLATVEQAAPFVGRSYHGELVLNALARRDTSGIV